jgi:hypothetical protein
MGSSRIGARKTRKMAAATGLDIIRAWSHGGYVHSFVTADHQHGYYDLKTGEWEFVCGGHFSSCRDELFPGFDGKHIHEGHWYPLVNSQCLGCGCKFPSPPARDLDQKALDEWIAANEGRTGGTLLTNKFEGGRTRDVTELE